MKELGMAKTRAGKNQEVPGSDTTRHEYRGKPHGYAGLIGRTSGKRKRGRAARRRRFVLRPHHRRERCIPAPGYHSCSSLP